MAVSKEQADVWFRQAVEDRDAQAAFALGELYLGRTGNRGKAQRWFEYAVALDHGADLLWRITEVCAATGRMEPARTWMRRAITAEWAGCEFVIDPTVFPFYDYYGTGDISGQAFVVQVSAQPPEAALAALKAASPRFMRVNENGAEVQGDERDDDRYTPNSLSDVHDDVAGVWLSMDCKDYVMPLMARTDIRIIVEELRRADAMAGHVGVPSHKLLDWFPADK